MRSPFCSQAVPTNEHASAGLVVWKGNPRGTSSPGVHALAKALALLIDVLMFIELVQSHSRRRIVRCDSGSNRTLAFTMVALALMARVGNAVAATDGLSRNVPTTAAGQVPCHERRQVSF